MGADVFIDREYGATAQEAFDGAVQSAQWDRGHGGYTGTIAEKDSFVMIELPEGADPEKEAYRLIDESDSRINDKWGPAGCFDLGGGGYLFFGWASS